MQPFAYRIVSQDVERFYVGGRTLEFPLGTVPVVEAIGEHIARVQDVLKAAGE